jgi:hypothetical protein
MKAAVDIEDLHYGGYGKISEPGELDLYSSDPTTEASELLGKELWTPARSAIR